MTSESQRPDERRWLVDPPAPNSVHFQIAAGDRVEMTPEIEAAFEHLLEVLSVADVEGYEVAASDCAGYKKGCTTNIFSCSPRRKCFAEVQQPCLIDYHCVISP
jgi:hypothetical protein